MTTRATSPARPGNHRILKTLFTAEWAAGIFGLKLFVACVAIATFMMGAVWILGDGLSRTLTRGGTMFLGGDVAVTATNLPLPDQLETRLRDLAPMSEVAELRTSAQTGGVRVAVEVKGVDAAYPLYGRVGLASGRSFAAALETGGDHPPAIVESALLARTGAAVGDTIRLGSHEFVISDVLTLEPDRLSAGRFMVGPRVLVRLDDLRNGDLIQRGSLVEYRYRLLDPQGNAEQLTAAVAGLEPESGWELESPADAGDRVLRTVNRTTTFLGMAGIAAFAIGLSGGWAAARSWIVRRTRTIALYRLSGATPGMVVSLHALIMALASIVGLVIGLGAATIVAVPLLDIITARLHVPWSASDVVTQLATVATILVVGLTGTGLLALSGAARISPGAAMRNGVASLRTDPLHAAIGTGFLVAAMAGGALSLPIPALAGLATAGLAAATGLLALAAGIMARIVARRAPRSFIGIVACQSLGNAGHAASRTVAIGIGIVGITAIVAAQSSLDHALNSELPERVPDLVLLDVQPDQVDSIRERIETTPGLGGLQANPFMRMTLTAVNGVPARDALRRADKSWVIEGDRSFSWTATPTGAELLAGSWWDADYTGPPVVSPEEDLMEAFDLKVGDVLTYGVLGRSFTSEVVNIRKEYHRTFRPEFLMLASPQPFRDAPQSWIMSLQGETDGDVDTLIRDLATAHPNVTSIDVRLIAAQVGSAIEGASLASLLVAVLLIVAGAFSLAALVASDVDSRRQEALVYALVGASRREIALARLSEAALIGAIAAILGGITGAIGGYFSVTEALHVAWIPGAGVILIPVALGIASSVAAGIVGGLGAAPRGRGEMVRQLTG